MSLYYRNILFIIADDIGKDATLGFVEGTFKPNTPHLNSLKSTGLSFNNLWVSPTCSPTRSSIITGKYGYRTGVKWAGDMLANSETILHRYISEQTNDAYATAIVGKWHLAEGRAFNPEILGMDYYVGILSGVIANYYRWSLSEDGTSSVRTEYVTQYLTDLAINWTGNQQKPWFLWLAYNAPHTPFHSPPSEMYAQGDLPDYTSTTNPMPYYMAAIEAMDFQIGRLFASLSAADVRENTVIIFIGDNGSPNQVAQSLYTRGQVKGTLYQGGVNTPMFISGDGVTRTGGDETLINSTDLFATIAAIAGVIVLTINDSRSFSFLLKSSGSHNRDYQYTEMNDGNDDLWTICNQVYKLIINANGNEEMYNLGTNLYEKANMLEGVLSSQQQAVNLALETELSRIRS